VSNEEHFEGSEVVRQKEEHIENCGPETKPDAPGLAGYESMRNVEDATNPKNLAAKEHHESSKPQHGIYWPHLAERGQQKGAQGN